MHRDELVAYLDEYLRIHEIQDYGPQGLQVEGRETVHKIVGMVDAQIPCVEAALAHGADFVLVHHGIFWREPQRLVGGFRKLVQLYLGNNLNLYAAHLALDAHPQVGNNVTLAQRLGLTVVDRWASVNGTPIGVLAESPEPLEVDQVVARYEAQVGPVLQVQSHGPAAVRRVGILSGSGASHIQEAARLGCDLLLTGETSHAAYYDGQTAGIHVIYGGHYTTETVGVQALGRHLQERFDVEFEFVDLPTGL